MKQLVAFFRLIRYPNLIYIFLTQYLLQYCVIIPVLAHYGLKPTLNNIQLFLLSLSTVLIAAAGYIINDYFDLNIDQVNKPQKIVIDRIINRRWAMAWHTLFNVAGVALGFFIAWQIGNLSLGFIQLFCTGLLWFYSTSYKRQLLIGNVVIAVLTALTVAVIGFYEPQLYKHINILSAPAAYHLLRVISVYTLFAFVISLIREIVKDMEDIKGDAREGCKTIPVIWGLRTGKYFCYILSILLILLITIAQLKVLAWQWYGTVIYLLLLVQLPMIWQIVVLFKAARPKDFHKVSSLIKVIMLTGILSMMFFINFS